MLYVSFVLLKYEHLEFNLNKFPLYIKSASNINTETESTLHLFILFFILTIKIKCKSLMENFEVKRININN